MIETDIAIVGGGIAGLSAGIIARRLGHSVVLLEKKTYPFHKVCGEYISLESLDLLKWLGLPVREWNLPELSRFRITHPKGKDFGTHLPLGGIGISRFRLDDFLKSQLILEGGLVFDNTLVSDVQTGSDFFTVHSTHPQHPIVKAGFVLGSFGRNKPVFSKGNLAEPVASKRYIGVKMHVAADIPKDRIELHHFPGGYCGISAVEDNKYCLCYLLEETRLAPFKGNIPEMEKALLHQNPFLKRYLTEFGKLNERVSTAGVFFQPRPHHQNGILFLGDSAGMIPPLAGNGMSMALHSAVLAMNRVDLCLKGELKREHLSQSYDSAWNAVFARRLSMARTLQKIMEQPGMTALTMTAFKVAPFLFRWAAAQTHGVRIPVPVR